MRVQEYLQTHVRPRRHTVQLIAIITLLAMRPLVGDVGAAPIVFSIALVTVMLFSLYAIRVDDLVGDRAVLLAQRRRRSVVGWAFAVVGVAERLGTMVVPSSGLYALGAISWFLFFLFVTVNQLRSVLRQKEITGETISMSVSVYLLLGITWGLLYVVIFAFHPQAFSFGSAPAPVLVSKDQNTFPIFVYFSLTTLSTIGFGDITPVSMQARYAAVAEGITGQFYLAILVARLVGMQMSRAATLSTSARAENRRPENPDP
ncbi:MAG TPA: potassium channel family protein [Candidatus Kryptonia bacterium]|nr:potassium channel family protein [Candidatus Kryptonia bacterium]